LRSSLGIGSVYLAVLLCTDSESLPQFGGLCCSQEVPRRIKRLEHGVPLKFASVVTEHNARRDPAYAKEVPR
jgi:hypothetical protein